MTINRRRFLLSSLASAATAPQLFSMQQPRKRPPGLMPPETSASFGSGNFGEWINDEFGLPAFHYTCDQTSDPRASTPVTPGILAPTEHVHQVGNDRIVAIASNYGHVRVRQDEGGPKLLNDYTPDTNQFAGGFGYLTDGREILSTFYVGNNPTFERIFGVGYFRKRVANKAWSIDQVISAPFGDDPVLLSQVTISNLNASHAACWVEYWGCQSYQFSFRAFMESLAGIGAAAQLRREAGRSFTHQVHTIRGTRGLFETRHSPGQSPKVDAVWQRVRTALEAQPNGFFAPAPDPRPGTWYESADLPPTFLVALDASASGFSTNGRAFFGSGGPSNPRGLASRLDGDLGSSGPETALLLERSIHLNPGEAQTLYFLYGYLPSGFELEAMIDKYEAHAPRVLAESCAQWKHHGTRFEVDSEPWVSREVTWNYYNLRSSLTFDDFFDRHILNQNGFYQYVMGFQGAARDPLQHCLPFIFSDSEIVRGVLRYTLEEIRPDGSIPYGITGHGVIVPLSIDNSSDLPLWLLWAVSEYVLATRDLDFLNEKISARVSGGGSDTVLNLLERCFRHQVRDVGTGRHGLVRMLNDDWNDALLSAWAATDLDECVKEGESVLNSTMSAWVFDQYARLLRYAGVNSELQQQLTQTADTSRQAARAQWTGQWLRRAWLGRTLGWLGESTLWLEPQPWAIFAGVTSPAQSRDLVQSINALLRHGPLGAAQMSQGPDMMKTDAFAPGTMVRGGILPSLNQTLTWALATIDPAMAWEEWKRNSLAAHAEAYPNIWYGVWSGPDSYNASFSKSPGESPNDTHFNETEFPVFNLHSHACSLYSATKLLGIEFTEHGVTIRPVFPVPSYRFESPLLGISMTPEGRFAGWYAPSRAGTWALRIELARDARSITHAEINGAPAPIMKLPDGAIELRGSSDLKRPMRWTLR